jgi:hypothetical protein
LDFLPALAPVLSRERRATMLKKLVVFGVPAIIVVFVVLQLLPMGRGQQTNPPVVDELAWNTAETRALAERACFDCHSNETEWPWYSRIAPMSWLVTRDVIQGRDHMNFSDWGEAGQDIEDIIEQIEEGNMPPSFYLPMHPEAQLNAGEKTQLIEGFRTTLAAVEGGAEAEAEDARD